MAVDETSSMLLCGRPGFRSLRHHFNGGNTPAFHTNVGGFVNNLAIVGDVLLYIIDRVAAFLFMCKATVSAPRFSCGGLYCRRRLYMVVKRIGMLPYPLSGLFSLRITTDVSNPAAHSVWVLQLRIVQSSLDTFIQTDKPSRSPPQAVFFSRLNIVDVSTPHQHAVA